MADLREQLERFRENAAKARLANPYFVLAGEQNFLIREAKNIGGHVIGSYAPGSEEDSRPKPYARTLLKRKTSFPGWSEAGPAAIIAS